MTPTPKPITTPEQALEAARDIALQHSYSNSYFISKRATDIADEITALRASIAPAPDYSAEVAAKNVWPNFTSPIMYPDAHEGWTDPELPDFRLIWKTARLAGYAGGLHGSMKRDCDMIAAPWVPEAVSAEELIRRLCGALNAVAIGKPEHCPEQKPFGRLAWNLQINGWKRVIDISVAPREHGQSALAPPPDVAQAARDAAFVIAYLERETGVTFGDMIGMMDTDRIRALAGDKP